MMQRRWRDHTNVPTLSWLKRSLLSIPLSVLTWQTAIVPLFAAAPRAVDQTIECDLLVIGAGLSGAATAYEGLLAGQAVCLTEMTDWLGGQISSQGTSALDERDTQRSQLYYPRGYLELRERIEETYGQLNPGDCWVSASCFLPQDGHKILLAQLQGAAKKGQGKLHWLPSTVVKELEISDRPNSGSGQQILSVTAIQHRPAPGAPPLNTFPLSQTIEDWYRYEDSQRFEKSIVRLVPAEKEGSKPADWYVVEATETGEIVGLANVPYRLGIDPRSYLDPSASSATADPYCTQGFTYTFAMEQTEEPQENPKPAFYEQYAPYYSYELERLASFNLVFTYRRIWSPETGEPETFRGIEFSTPTPGDISMQNWTWGNDYRPGTAKDNLIYTPAQLQATGQLATGGWLGGIRTESLRKAEELALGYFYWLVAGTTDSQLPDDVKKPYPNHRLLKGFDSPMGTVHGLSKHPYMREGRRIVGRPSYDRSEGFMVNEIDISRLDYQTDYYQQTLSPQTYDRLLSVLSPLDGLAALNGDSSSNMKTRRSRSTVYPDGVGIGFYAIDFHPCMTLSPPEAPGNKERAGERRGAKLAYPFQIPLRAMIPQQLDNVLVAGKSIATSHIAAAAYRVHSFEWSVGAAAGMTAAFALEQGILPYQLVDQPIYKEKEFLQLQRAMNESGNPTAFPNTSIFNDTWDEWQ